MPRTSSYELVLDSGLFAPTQIETVAVARLGFQFGTRWLRDHVCSHQSMIADHQVGFVLWALHLRYENRLRFIDAERADVDVHVRVRGPRSSQLEMMMTIAGPHGVAVRSEATAIPLRLSGDEALSGAPAHMPEWLIERFHDDEREPSPFRSQVPALGARLKRDAVRVASEITTFRVHRHHCDAADQWYWPESLGFTGAAREEFIIQHGRKLPQLRRALIEGLRQVDAIWLRASYLWDVMLIHTTCYRQGDETAFVHELRQAGDDRGGPYAVVVERA